VKVESWFSSEKYSSLIALILQIYTQKYEDFDFVLQIYSMLVTNTSYLVTKISPLVNRKTICSNFLQYLPESSSCTNEPLASLSDLTGHKLLIIIKLSVILEGTISVYHFTKFVFLLDSRCEKLAMHFLYSFYKNENNLSKIWFIK
jgi:hypothetical protein